MSRNSRGVIASSQDVNFTKYISPVAGKLLFKNNTLKYSKFFLIGPGSKLYYDVFSRAKLTEATIELHSYPQVRFYASAKIKLYLFLR